MRKSLSVCISVYQRDDATWFREALNSVFAQTYMPDEVVLVVDGVVPAEIDEVISDFSNKETPLVVIRLEKNSGHAIARQTGLDAAHYEYTAIMDSDDIAVEDRFEKQMAYLEKHPEIDVLGGQINEFIGNPANVVGARIVPLFDDEIKTYLKSRCPMNLVTVVLKKDSVLKAGGYIDWYCEEDYYLWVRMTERGMIFANLPDNLVNVRVGEEMYQRRGGWKYFKSEAKLQRYMMEHDLISFPKYLYNVILRFTVQVIMPNKLRGWVFQKFARE